VSFPRSIREPIKQLLGNRPYKSSEGMNHVINRGIDDTDVADDHHEPKRIGKREHCGHQRIQQFTKRLGGATGGELNLITTIV
jgi:hypothetical protein